MFDILITGGRVIDPETGHDGIADVAIEGGRIAAIGQNLGAARRTIAADGLVVAPGFVDIHAHGQTVPADRMQAFDGVTTALELEVGALPVAAWYEAQAKVPRVLNYGVAAAWIMARKQAIAGIDPIEGEPAVTAMSRNSEDTRWSRDTATDEQARQIVALTREGIEEGGLGIGIPYAYAPGAGAKEMSLICDLAAASDVPTYTHVAQMSNIDPKSSVEAYVNLIGLSAATGAHMHICHLNSTSLQDIERAAQLIAKAQAAGIKVTTEAYPYGTGSTFLGAAFFADANFVARTGSTYSDIQLVSAQHALSGPDEYAAERARQPGALVLWRYLDTENNERHRRLLDVSVMFPGSAIASDAMPWSNPDGTPYDGMEWPLSAERTSHPRSSGTFTRFLRRWCIDGEALPLIDAIAKCTLIPAQIVERTAPVFRRKGRLQVGADADITVFDPVTLLDRATFSEMNRPSDGMVHVLVNGTPVISNRGLVEDAAPGRPIRRGDR
ncbi:MAG TPA: amidohydrolase family protein [Devosia sp.]|nr:amidohydrolase family protein [Devosia sp.]